VDVCADSVVGLFDNASVKKRLSVM